MSNLPFNAAAASSPANDNAVPTLDQQLLRAAEFGDTDKMKSLLKQGANINARHTNNDTPLMIAVREHKLPAVLLLLRRKAEVSLKNNFGQTAFFIATALLPSRPVEGDERIFRALLRRKSPVNEPEDEGGFPVHNLIVTNRAKALTTFVAAGGDLKVREKNGVTPMMLASYLGESREVIAAMMPHDFGLDMQDNKKMTALMHALSSGNEELGAAFIGMGANVFLSDAEGSRALTIAEKMSLPKSVQLLAATEAKAYAPLKEGLGIDAAAPARAAFRKKTPSI